MADVDRELGRVDAEIEHLKGRQDRQEEICERCLVRKVVFGVVGVVGLGVLAAIIALVVRAPK